MNPIFSVIIPLYNREALIDKAIKSVLNQTFKDFELIIVDDCSTDGSFEWVKRFTDERIILLKHEKNLGAAGARNTGIKNAKGKYISLLDSDDYYDLDFLRQTFEIISTTKPTIGFMWTGYILKNDNKYNESIWIPKFINNTYETFLNELKVGTNAGITVKREVFEVCSFFNQNLQAAEDTEFFLRISKKYDYTYCENKLITICRDGEDRLSKNYKKNAEAYNSFIPSHFPKINKTKLLQKKYLYKLMWLNYHIPDKKKSRTYFYTLLKNNNLTTKMVFVFLLYEFLPLSISSKIHQKISGI